MQVGTSLEALPDSPGGGGSSLVRNTGPWLTQVDRDRNRVILIVAAAALALAASDDPGERTLVDIHLRVTIDCWVKNDPRTGGPARYRRYEAYSGERSLANDPRVTISQQVYSPSGALTRNDLNPRGSGDRGVFDDGLGLSAMLYSTGTEYSYQYFTISIAGTAMQDAPVRIVGMGGQSTWFNAITKSITRSPAGPVHQVVINDDRGFSGISQCTKEQVDLIGPR